MRTKQDETVEEEEEKKEREQVQEQEESLTAANQCPCGTTSPRTKSLTGLSGEVREPSRPPIVNKIGLSLSSAQSTTTARQQSWAGPTSLTRASSLRRLRDKAGELPVAARASAL